MSRPADWGFRLKSEFIDVGLLSAPFLAVPRHGGGRKMANVTNSTGALVDFLVVMGAAVSLSARYSKFGSLLCNIRQRYLPVSPTYTYGTAFGLKSCSVRNSREFDNMMRDWAPPGPLSRTMGQRLDTTRNSALALTLRGLMKPQGT